MGFSGKQIAAITITLVVIGEVTFYLSLILLGKSFFNKIKGKLQFSKIKNTKNNEL